MWLAGLPVAPPPVWQVWQLPAATPWWLKLVPTYVLVLWQVLHASEVELLQQDGRCQHARRPRPGQPDDQRDACEEDGVVDDPEHTPARPEDRKRAPPPWVVLEQHTAAKRDGWTERQERQSDAGDDERHIGPDPGLSRSVRR